MRIMLSLLLLSAVFAEFTAASLVHIDQGTLNGTVLKSRNGQEFYAFYGIPYAQPPIHELRFQPPRPPLSWEGIRNATQKPPFCRQMYVMQDEGYSESEDCLFLQVYTHNISPENSTALRPVLVFIHGGGFSEGGSTVHEPYFFMDKPIVMVTVGSRLGVLGFFSTGQPSYPGNYGLKDQSAALQWIQKNIRAFGGDPSAVTLMGHSSGSTAVHHHTLSPLSKGIFHRAILQSATANMLSLAFSTTDQARRNFQSFKEHANCSRASTNESVACLLALPANELSNLGQTYRDVDSRPFPFNPVIEPFGSEGAFLPTDPRKLVYIDSQMPLIFGFTSNEQMSPERKHKLSCTADEKTFDDLLLEELHYKPNDDRLSLAQKTIALVKELYFGNNFSNCSYKTTTIILSDILFKFPILESISTYPARVYAFEYDYRDTPASQELGVGHGEELKVLVPKPSAEELNDEKRKLSETMITYWSNFISTGDPNAPDKTTPIEWLLAKNSTDGYLNIMDISKNGFRIKQELISEKIKLWTNYKKIYYGV